jgi:hypothetical protein
VAAEALEVDAAHKKVVTSAKTTARSRDLLPDVLDDSSISATA